MKTVTPVKVYVADDNPLDGILLETTKASIRRVQLPGGRVVRFQKQGFDMGDQRSRYSISAWV